MKEVYLIWTSVGQQYEEWYDSVLWIGLHFPTNCELRKILNVNITKQHIQQLKKMNRFGNPFFEVEGGDRMTVWIEKRELYE